MNRRDRVDSAVFACVLVSGWVFVVWALLSAATA